MIARRLAVRSPRGAYAALVVLTLVWGTNWIAMKLALGHADPIVYNIQRTWVAVAALVAVLVWQRRRFLPESWAAVCVTGLFQAINMSSTVMALADSGAGRTSVLVFTMPFWTLLLAWPVLDERVRGSQWIAIAFAVGGLALVVEPWNWHGELGPKLWAVLSGFGWAAATVAMKYFQQERGFDMLNFATWQTFAGILPLSLLPLAIPLPAVQWDSTYVLLLFWTGAVSTAGGFLLWIGVLRFLPAGTASLNILAIPVIALISSMLIFGERLVANEWLGIACIGVGLMIVTLRTWSASRRGERPPPDPIPLEGG